jgi:chromosome segregation ATPase
MAAQAYLNYECPYNVKMQALKSEADAVKPDIEQIQKILKMTKEDIKKSGNGADQLGDKGVVFRKFDMLIEAVEKAQKKIYDLWHQGEIARPNFEDDIKNLKTEAKKYRDKIGELSARLMKQKTCLWQMIKDKQDAAMSAARCPDRLSLRYSMPSRKE